MISDGLGHYQHGHHNVNGSGVVIPCFGGFFESWEALTTDTWVPDLEILTNLGLKAGQLGLCDPRRMGGICSESGSLEG